MLRAWTGKQKAAVLVTIAYMVFFIYMLIVRPGSRHFYDAFFNIYQIFPPLFASAAGLFYFFKGRHSNRTRRIGWLLIALACLSFTIGQCTWTYLESIKGVLVPFPSWADAGYLGTYVFLVAGVMLLFGSMPVSGRARQLLDSAIAASSLGVLSWSFLVQRIWNQSDVSLIGKCISVAYPLGDIASLFAVLVLLSNSRHSRQLMRSLLFLAVGIFGFAFFDTSFTFMSLNGTYQTGSWSDWTVSFGWIAVGYSFLNRIWWVSELRTGPISCEVPSIIQARSLRQMVLPYAAVVTASVIVAFRDYGRDGNVQNSTIAAWAFLMVLVMVRQILALAENRTLTIQLKEFNDNLEKVIAERTAELEVQNKRVLDLMEERNRFFRYVSHEFRTPLTSVIGFTECMIDDEDEPVTRGQKAQLERVLGSAHKLLGMVNDLLDISKIEAGRMEVQYSSVDLNDLVEQVVDTVKPLASEKALVMRMDLANDLPVIVTDEQKLAQIVMNLLSNAVKYTYDGTIRISTVKNHKFISILVSDTGIGIPEDETEKIFQEFYRVQGGSVQRGTGLGLTIVQKFTELLGGRIEVQSKPGAGSTFTVTLPIVAKSAHKSGKVTVH